MFLRKTIYYGLLFSLFAIAVGFGAYKSMPLLLGPTIEISSPENGTIVEGTTIIIRGYTYRAKTLFINELPTSFSDTGLFETKTSVYPGNNIFKIKAEDKFGRSSEMILSIGAK